MKDIVLPGPDAVSEIRYGRDPLLDARLLCFLMENNLDPVLSPHLNAPPAQLRFMVALDENQFFAPCSDELFHSLLQPVLTSGLREAYNAAWRVFIRLVREHVAEDFARKRIVAFCRHVFGKAVSTHVIIPSRLTKRLTGIFTTQSGLDDPFRERKQAYNRRAALVLRSSVVDRLLNLCPAEALVCSRLTDLRFELDLLELQRLFMLSSWIEVWGGSESMPAAEAQEKTLARLLARPCEDFESLRRCLGPARSEPKRILYLPNLSGGVLFDLMIIRALLRQGHQVMLALKEGFYFQTPTIWDPETDPVLAEALEGAHFLRTARATKRELLAELNAHKFVVLSDGTSERLNLCRVSVTFARAWKEADLIIAKGAPHLRRLILTRRRFTRDILCFHRDQTGSFHIDFKPRDSAVRKFSEADLIQKAEVIIQEMREAKRSGKSVMFYSAIVGSIPGETKTAIRILDVFVKTLRGRLQDTYVINPSEHFEPGMDGDDLMFMWERVQRSGLIDVWRFQTVQDIEESFDRLGRRVPPVWAGKDATFSTGCTQEMRIALETQARKPELQIIGPSPDKFFRRREYGVGKYFDAGIPA